MQKACIELAAKWEPLNMDGQKRIKVGNATDCQKHCAQIHGCAHFSWWTDGGCHVQDASAQKFVDDVEAVAGPADCGAGPWCFESTHEWTPSVAGDDEPSHQDSADACQAHCFDTAGCLHFTYLADGTCHLQNATAERRNASKAVISGPRSCSPRYRSSLGYITSGHNLLVDKMTLSQAKLRCATLGCSGFTYLGAAGTSEEVTVYIKSKFEVKETTIGSGWVWYRPEALPIPAAAASEVAGASVSNKLIEERVLTSRSAWDALVPRAPHLRGLAGAGLGLIALAAAFASVRKHRQRQYSEGHLTAVLFVDGDTTDDAPLE